jgi:acetylornithine/succinyldiaminopimelate/putrescine aminotransferase
MEEIKNISLSLTDLLGADYIDAVCTAQTFLSGADKSQLLSVANERVEFFPAKYLARCDELLEFIGRKMGDAFNGSSDGAGTASFEQALKRNMAPLSGLGFVRLGEDGRLYFTGKSEHYHAPLGHNFPGYKLLENARRIGITNITHNNTRGHITRLLERELIRVANGLDSGDEAGLEAVIRSQSPHVLNRVINLETGSLAMEAALKMMLVRFYRLDATYDAPRYQGKTPVFLVMADNQGGPQANYHGTTVLTQILRGMWPDFAERLEAEMLYVVKPVKINDIENFRELVERYDKGDYKIAGFLHELVLMNYGGIKLTPEYVTMTHAICDEHDIPVVIDEIQSCIWSPELFLFKEYNCNPDFVSVGKGFPGGEYPASKILTTTPLDSLNQFGALVTNGQEELASLSYLVTMAFAEANREYTLYIGKYYRERLEQLAAEYSAVIDKIEGEAHLSTIFFKNAEDANTFTGYLNNECCIDVSAQTYKADCPPAALTKLPLITSPAAIDFIIGKMAKALFSIQNLSIKKRGDQCIRKKDQRIRKKEYVMQY